MHLTIITYFGAESQACRVLRYYFVPYTMCIYSKQEASGVLDPASEKKHEAQQRWPRKPIGTLWRKYLLFFFIICFELIDHLQVLCSSGEHIMFLIPGMLPEHTKVRGDMWSGWACFSLISRLSISLSLQHETKLIKPFWSSAPAGKILIWRFFKHTTADIRVWKSNTSLLVPDSLLTWCRDPGGSSTRLRWTTSFFAN